MKNNERSLVPIIVVKILFSALLPPLSSSAQTRVFEFAKEDGGLRIVNQSKTRMYFFSVTDLWGDMPTNFFFGTIQPESKSMWVPFPHGKDHVNLANFTWLEQNVNNHEGFSYQEDVPIFNRGQWVEYVVNPTGGGDGCRIVNLPFEKDERIQGTLGETRVLQVRGNIDNLKTAEKEWQQLIFLSFIESMVKSKFHINMPAAWMLGYYASALTDVDLRLSIHDRFPILKYRMDLAKQLGKDRFNEYFIAGVDVGRRLLAVGSRVRAQKLTD